LRRPVLASAVFLACVCTAVSASASAGSNRAAGGRSSSAVARAALGTEIVTYERTTWRWEQLMGAPRTQTAGRTLAEMSAPDVQQALSLWRNRADAAYRRAQRPPHRTAWLCLHRYEGSWKDTGAPYYGGLQMNLTFQERYGSWLYRHKGTADHWTPLEQMWTAEKALKSRGFWPWPNTARMCGLL
jgi:hypothetical protein